MSVAPGSVLAAGRFGMPPAWLAVPPRWGFWSCLLDCPRRPPVSVEASREANRIERRGSCDFLLTGRASTPVASWNVDPAIRLTRGLSRVRSVLIPEAQRGFDNGVPFR